MMGFKIWGRLALAAGLWSAAAWCGAETLQDWSGLKPGTAGTFLDKDGSTLDFSQMEGPKSGEKALGMKIHLIDWGGLWSILDRDLPKAGALRFMAKSSQPEILEVGLTDRQQVRYVAPIRILSDDWKEFVVPLSLFKRDVYQVPEAPKDKPLEWSEIRTLQFIPQTHGDMTLQIGPISFQKGKVMADTGMSESKSTLIVQDFAFLDKASCGPYTDEKTGTTISLTFEKDPDGKGGRVADFQYLIKKDGWGGYWMRAGDVWGGQDWTGAKVFSMEVYTSEPMQFQIGFNDSNQNAYVAKTGETRGKGWEKLDLPFDQFQLNPYYQPSDAKKGMAQDLSHVETINVAPLTEGTHDFKVRKITLEK